MIVNQCKTYLDYQPYGEQCDYCELDNYDLSKIPKTVKEIWYWYKTVSYEGMGQMILRTDEGYHLWDMGHCSCYGPVERLELGETYSSIEELKSNCSEDLLQELPLMTGLINITTYEATNE